ncbi:hypothetical protein DPMN_048915 [Dreissena polymorpha]|uniref:Uncharacterized protein n=1 Tax=Dreissena polymorpha TaxID=45954 RepID=A0A9D4I2U0_DREPO|nr:hypothetical protein DPMN_048915 [Dreissena polymorpha]
MACSKRTRTKPDRLHSDTATVPPTGKFTTRFYAGDETVHVQHQQSEYKKFHGADIGSNHGIILTNIKLEV